ncbi:glycosyltransferase [Candidatus Nanohalococcus occultus]|uniref:Glycosyl transferase family 2 n=1 Tax=Candidatus Nanohalococcus occultus TaxID=2978047 RepID=A0ABY8CK68_9ARCH|nr:Glycosyl transferase family 2 [Candidatus Nanohaloarchaeota archaeon SVXNc]
MKISLICTVYNEGESIRDLLDSLLDQTRLPDEAVFVDGGSIDNTQEIIEEYAEENEWIKLYVDEGCNIAEGRNTAVRKAENDYIVGTDGGCILDENWLESMAAEFEDGYEFVVGMWKPRSEKMFERVQGRIIASKMSPEEVKKGNRSASSRSVGFTRKVWIEVGGYPEELYTGEDSKFNAEILAKGYEQGVAENAWVEWKMRPTWRSLWEQFKTYGEGDAKGGNLFTHHSKKLGLTKNLLLTAYAKTFLLTLIATAVSARYIPEYIKYLVLLLVLEVIGPLIYEKGAIIESLREDGFKAFVFALGISQIKLWAWFTGFAVTCFRKPSLLPYQLKEVIRLR